MNRRWIGLAVVLSACTSAGETAEQGRPDDDADVAEAGPTRTRRALPGVDVGLSSCPEPPPDAGDMDLCHVANGADVIAVGRVRSLRPLYARPIDWLWNGADASDGSWCESDVNVTAAVLTLDDVEVLWGAIGYDTVEVLLLSSVTAFWQPSLAFPVGYDEELRWADASLYDVDADQLHEGDEIGIFAFDLDGRGKWMQTLRVFNTGFSTLADDEPVVFQPTSQGEECEGGFDWHGAGTLREMRARLGRCIGAERGPDGPGPRGALYATEEWFAPSTICTGSPSPNPPIDEDEEFIPPDETPAPDLPDEFRFRAERRPSR